MQSEIFYFSGTGNSLFVARELSKQIGGKVIPIAKVVGNQAIAIDSDVLGIVFPSYYGVLGENGIPFIVQSFVRKLVNIGGKYIFAVCTHRGFPGSTVGNLAALIKTQGGTLAAEFDVRMAFSYSIFDRINYALFRKPLPEHTLREKELQTTLRENCTETLARIARIVADRKTSELETPGRFARILSSFLRSFLKQLAVSRYKRLANSTNQSLEYLHKNADRSFFVNDKCVGCGACSRICPVSNITINDSRPEWQHKCENCYACYTWCPNAAIHGDIVEYERRYHHPTVTLSDMFWRDSADWGD